MTNEQTYAAVFHFLKKNWELNNSMELGDLLGAMSLLQDGKPADPAMWQMWQQAVDYALAGGKAGQLELH